jgi:hypothetical protein
MNNFNDKVSFIWSVADLLRGPYKPAQYGDVVLPLVVLRRLDCVLEPTKPKVLERYMALKGQKHTEAELDAILNRVARQQFHNRSKFDFEKLKDDPDKIKDNLLHYGGGFSQKLKQPSRQSSRKFCKWSRGCSVTDATQYQTALGKLREVLVNFKPGHPVYDAIVPWRESVLARFQPVFSLQNLDALSADEFKAFLQDSNNHHWSGLNRKGWRACEDVGQLRAALKVLLDEAQPLERRVDEMIDHVPGMGKALTTAILLVAYPDRYGVWNNTSEGGLKSLGIWPEFERGSTWGRRYAKINEVLSDLSRDLGLDRWTLDALWWSVMAGTELPHGWSQEDEITAERGAAIEALPQMVQRFALERHLQDFLLDNWPRTELGREWAIFAEDGDDEAGYEYPTKVGRIDLLAKHKREPRWLVVELKRDQTSDATVGQALRYMGWVKQNLAKRDEQVEGLVIAHEADESIKYAISAIPNVRLMLYEVEFRLKFAPAAWSM